MAKAANTDPAWFAKLSSVDRAIARKMRQEFSESAMLRILAAMKPDGKRGAKGKATPEGWVRIALEAFLSQDGMTVGKAAGIAATAIHTAGNLEETRKNTIRKISGALQPFNLEDLQLIDLKPLFPVADEMRKAGKHVRADIFPLRQQVINSTLSSFCTPSDRWEKCTSSIERLNEVMSRINSATTWSSTAEAIERIQEFFMPSEEERLRQDRALETV